MYTIASKEDLERIVLEIGFLPFFHCGISGFSIEEMVVKDLWFSDSEEGPWDWKGPVIQDSDIAYGKFFRRKAVFVAREWLADLLNFRRHCPVRVTDDQAALDDIVLQTIEQEGSATIKELRQLLGFACGKGRRRTASDFVDTLPMDEETKISLDPILGRLQMKGRVVIKDFDYNIDRHGNRYGWGIARYATPESLYGHDVADADGRSPIESYERIRERLLTMWPGATPKQVEKLIAM